jgi:hypothetical protein
VSKHLTFVSDCAPAVIAIAVYRNEDVDPGIKAMLAYTTIRLHLPSSYAQAASIENYGEPWASA